MNTTNIISCINAALKIKDTYFNADDLSIEDLNELFDIAVKHQIPHIVAISVSYSKKHAGSEVYNTFRGSIYTALMFDEKRDFVINKVCNFFEYEEIPHIFLKGSELCHLYPQTWMRNSCDIDILVKNEDIDRAADTLETLGFSLKKRGSHDILFFSPEGVTIELHFRLIETDEKVNRILEKVWETASVYKGYNYRHEMSKELFYFYHIAHMAKHFEMGGCGIRFFIDLWFLNCGQEIDLKERDRLLKQGRLYEFNEKATVLSEIWFGEEKHDNITKLMENFVFESGIYGAQKNRVKIDKLESISKKHFILFRLFMPYKYMRLKYPILENLPFLLPIYWLRRWTEYFMNYQKIKNSVSEIELNAKLDKNEILQTEFLFEKLNLNKFNKCHNSTNSEYKGN